MEDKSFLLKTTNLSRTQVKFVPVYAQFKYDRIIHIYTCAYMYSE